MEYASIALRAVIVRFGGNSLRGNHRTSRVLHKAGGVPNSKHCTNQAFDMWPAGMDMKKVFCAAKQCGAGFINDEGNHWHFETVRHRNGNVGSLPTDCECK